MKAMALEGSYHIAFSQEPGTKPGFSMTYSVLSHPYFYSSTCLDLDLLELANSDWQNLGNPHRKVWSEKLS